MQMRGKLRQNEDLIADKYEAKTLNYVLATNKIDLRKIEVALGL